RCYLRREPGSHRPRCIADSGFDTQSQQSKHLVSTTLGIRSGTKPVSIFFIEPRSVHTEPQAPNLEPSTGSEDENANRCASSYRHRLLKMATHFRSVQISTSAGRFQERA